MAQEILLTMTKKELTRYEIIKRLIGKEINGTEASRQLDLSVRQAKRIKAKVIKEGVKGIIHKNRGKQGNRGLPEERIKRVEKIVKEKYADFGPTFASEKLSDNHQIKISKEKLRQLMTGWKLWKPKTRKENNEYRSWRQRKEYYGEMEQFDGSYHHWFEGRSEECCLLASIDDAMGKITKLKFVDWEGVKPAFIFWREYIETHSKPLKIYLDRHSTYKINAKSLFDDPSVLTQFERAMRDLDTEVIHAHSPQAKGRAERLFGTLQDRLVKELRLEGISTIEVANKFVEKEFIPKYNKKFAVLPQKKGNLHKPLNRFEKENLDKIFSIQDTRTINNDFTIRFKGKWFQLLETQPTLVCRKDKILIEERINGRIFISLRNKYLNNIVLPERPKKIEIKVIALARMKSSWKPPANHPWRRPLVLNPEKTYQTSSSMEKTS